MHPAKRWGWLVYSVFFCVTVACSGPAPSAPTPSTTPITEPAPAGPTATPAPLGHAEVVVAHGDLRSGPCASSVVVGNVAQGDSLPIYGKDETGAWLRVKWDEPVWLSTSLTFPDIALATVPVIAKEAASTPTESAADSTAGDKAEGHAAVYADDHLEILDLHSMQTSVCDSLWIFGEVHNIGTTTLKNIGIIITLYDSSGALLDVASGYVVTPWEKNIMIVGVLSPGEAAPFSLLYEAPGPWNETQIRVLYADARWADTSPHYYDLTVTHHTGRNLRNDRLNNYRVTGEVKNTGNSDCGPVWVVVTLYDDKGRVIGIGETLSGVVPFRPGDVEPFEVDVYAHGTVDSYQLMYSAVRQ